MILKNTPILSELESQYLPPSLQEWIESLASKTTDGETVFNSLHSKTDDGIVIQPIYTNNEKEVVDIPFLRNRAWQTLTTMPTDIEKWVECTNTPSSESMNAFYVPLEETVYSASFESNPVTALKTCLEHSNQVGKTALTSPLFSSVNAHQIESLIPKLSQQSHYVLFDPFHYVTYHNQIPSSKEALLQPLVDWCGALHSTQSKTIGVNTSVVSLGGATSVQEIGYAIASMVEYLRFADSKGIDAEALLQKMVCTLSVSTNFFEEVAKIRAIRIVWDSVLEYLGVDKSKRTMELHTVSAMKNLTKKDPFTNVLRTATSTMAGIVGNASAILIPHFDILHTIDPTPFSQKIAQQMHHIFAFESGLNDVVDPSKGSFFLEELTAQIAEKSLAYFKRIEQNGGIYQSLTDGSFQADVNAAKQASLRQYTDKTKKIVGTSYSPSETTYPQDAVWNTPHSTKKHPTIHSLQDGFQTISQFDRTRNSESFE
ncbi:MAG: hypothetical protein JNL36_10400 [Candidatus Kapabacteria bacterium]|nr:hypothetical protein [Candidatus Kapabacteria bacterium]